jgi:multidrug efflux system membrane fusion protein
VREGKISLGGDSKVVRVPISLALAGEKGFPHEGHVDFSNNQLDQATATLLVRAILLNPKLPVGERLFAPAMFVRVRLPIGPPYEALLVSEAAVGTDQNLTYLYIVNEKEKVVRRTVQLGSAQEGGLQVIASGLEPGERVVVNGLQHVQPDVQVAARLVEMPVPDAEVVQNVDQAPVVLKTPLPSPK